jgi:hypothetical protein
MGGGDIERDKGGGALRRFWVRKTVAWDLDLGWLKRSVSLVKNCGGGLVSGDQGLLG